jgi:hypothetical protein
MSDTFVPGPIASKLLVFLRDQNIHREFAANCVNLRSYLIQIEASPLMCTYFDEHDGGFSWSDRWSDSMKDHSFWADIAAAARREGVFDSD